MESIPYSREPYRVRKCNVSIPLLFSSYIYALFFVFFCSSLFLFDMKVLYYLEDGTMAVMEPKVQNSGISQGTLVRRHRPSKDDGSPLSYQDINTCMDVKLYLVLFFVFFRVFFFFLSKSSHGINYRIYETTDPFTIEFMEQMGFPISGFEDCPGDPHTEYPYDIFMSSFSPWFISFTCH